MAKKIGKRIIRLTEVGSTNTYLKENSDLELSKAILYLYKNKKIGKKFGTEGFKIIKKKFTLNKMINEHEREYLEQVNP